MKPEPVEQELLRLLPCPLFGHLPDKGEFTNGPYIAVSGAPGMPKFYAVVCPGCCSTAYDENKERVIKKWNTRADKHARLIQALHDIHAALPNGIALTPAETRIATIVAEALNPKDVTKTS